MRDFLIAIVAVMVGILVIDQVFTWLATRR